MQVVFLFALIMNAIWRKYFVEKCYFFIKSDNPFLIRQLHDMNNRTIVDFYLFNVSNS